MQNVVFPFLRGREQTLHMVKFSFNFFSVILVVYLCIFHSFQLDCCLLFISFTKKKNGISRRQAKDYWKQMLYFNLNKPETFMNRSHINYFFNERTELIKK